MFFAEQCHCLGPLSFDMSLSLKEPIHIQVEPTCRANGLALPSISSTSTEDTHFTTMSSNATKKANRNAEDRSGSPLPLSLADVEAASILMSLSRSGPNHTAVHKRAAPTSDLEAASILLSLSRSGPNRTGVNERAVPEFLIWDVRTMSRRLDPIVENDNGRVNPFGQAQINGPSSTRARSNPIAELAERLWSISLVHLVPPQIELASERFTPAAPSLPYVMRFLRCCEVPEEVGRFINLWDAAGYTPQMILQMLCRNNVIIPHEYIIRRLGLQNAVFSDSSLRTTSGGEEWNAGMPGVELTEEDDDEDERQDWESDLELWYDEH